MLGILKHVSWGLMGGGFQHGIHQISWQLVDLHNVDSPLRGFTK